MQILAAIEDPNPALAYGLIGMMILISLLYFAFSLWMVIDAICYEPAGSPHRIAWPMLILLFGGLPAFLYNITRRKQRIKLYGK